MRSASQRGIALVITLIMLAVVTVMAVVFLGISRRERSSVSVAASLTDAQLAADTGTARAQAQLLALITAQSNRLAYDLIVSTNFVNRGGFASGVSSPTNVSYTYANGSPLDLADQRILLRNLLYDPRPPVFVATNGTSQEFRFYLDLNRNGRFESNGWVRTYFRGVSAGTNYLVGDPEWIGVLDRPDQPHSASNRFVARFAYLVLPAGKTLDLNFMHNRAKRGALFEGFQRNQGVGSWEINLAAFLQALFPQYYDAPIFRPQSAAASSGWAYEDAANILNFRYRWFDQTTQTWRTDLPSASVLFGPRGATVFRTDGIDGYSDNIPPIMGTNFNVFEPPPSGAFPPVDDPSLPWAGADNPSGYYSYEDFFDAAKFPNCRFPNYLWTSVNTNHLQDTESEYAFTRLLGQLGTDSIPLSRTRLNANYVNGYWTNTLKAEVLLPGLETNFVGWADTDRTRRDFFMMTADRLLRTTYGGGFAQGIQVYPTNNYTAAVHRLLQLAANILDSTTNRLELGTTLTGSNAVYFPTVFRPILVQTNVPGVGPIVIISDYEEVINDTPLTYPWRDLKVAGDRTSLGRAVNVVGVPWVIGAKKGWPTFNEFYNENTVFVTRRLQAVKPSPSSQRFNIQQAYEVGMSNVFGVEAWNSYNRQLTTTQPLEVRVTNLVSWALWDFRRPVGAQRVAGTNAYYPILSLTTNFTTWEGRGNGNDLGYRVLVTNHTLVGQSAYRPSSTPALLPALPTVAFENTTGYPIPDWKLQITNRFTYILMGRDTAGVRRIVDFVTFDNLVGGFDINQALIGASNTFGSSGFNDNSFWYTNRAGNAALAPTAGITNQLYVSTNDVLARSDWRSLTDNPITGQQKEKAIDGFRMFLGMPPLFNTNQTTPPVGPAVQVPFTATRRIQQQLKWQVNDPLVHYHIEDVTDPVFSSTNNWQAVPPLSAPPKSNLGRMNERYRPWGGRPGTDTSDDRWAFNPGVKDPMVVNSDAWEFPSDHWPGLGWIGRVHRGTPWQTVYLKSRVEPPLDWQKLAGHLESHPTNDWRIVDLFTVGLNDNATRGLLSVNQTNLAAWAAVLGGVSVVSNTVRSPDRFAAAAYQTAFVEPLSPQLRSLVAGINTNRLLRLGRTYNYLGEILSAPALTDGSPFLDVAGIERGGLPKLSDAAYERIPQQILSLLKSDEPYVVIYSYGQALRPAERSVITAPGQFYGMVTNYQITGEALTKTALRLDQYGSGTNITYRGVVESYNLMPLD